MSGELDGTDIGLAVETLPGGGTFADIGGVTTNSFTVNNGAIDITNKSSAGWREILAGKGLQGVDISLSVIFSTDTNFAIMEGANFAQTLLNYQYARNGKTFTGPYKIVSWAETSPDNDKLTVDVSLQSAAAITVA